MGILIRGGTIVNPKDKKIYRADLLIEGRVISRIIPQSGRVEQKTAEGIAGKGERQDVKSPERMPRDFRRECRVIDASGAYVLPGLIDLHVHLREPGFEHKETIETGSLAALRGGFTTIAAMPNTKPVIDGPEMVEYVKERAASATPLNVMQIGAVTKGQEGRELSDISGMKMMGSPGISEDGKSVADSGLYREAMLRAAAEDMVVFAHCEDVALRGGGVINEGERAKSLGLPGISNAVEDVIAARDIILAKESGARLHLCHCSTKDSVEMVRLAKEAGVSLSAEVTPHHFTLCTDDIAEDDGDYKMNPPLRSREDMEALRQGLSDDVIDVIATDHAPHVADEKAGGFLGAAFGIVGLETAAAVTYTEMVDKGLLSMMQMAEKMSYNPARILKVDKGVISPGAAADLTIFDPERSWVVDPESFVSKGKNTPFRGRKLKGKVRCTIVDGEIAYEDTETKQ